MCLLSKIDGQRIAAVVQTESIVFGGSVIYCLIQTYIHRGFYGVTEKIKYFYKRKRPHNREASFISLLCIRFDERFIHHAQRSSALSVTIVIGIADDDDSADHAGDRFADGECQPYAKIIKQPRQKQQH